MQANAIQATDAQGRERPFVLEAPELALDGAALLVELAEARRLVERHFAAIPRAPGNGAITMVEPPQRAEKRVSHLVGACAVASHLMPNKKRRAFLRRFYH